MIPPEPNRFGFAWQKVLDLTPSEVGAAGNKLGLPQHAAILGKPHTGSPQSPVCRPQFKVYRADPNFGSVGRLNVFIFGGQPKI